MTKKIIKEEENKIEELTNNWKRALADYQNLQRRYNQDRMDFAKCAKAELLLSIIPILNHLETASVHLKDQGLEMVTTEFKNVFASEGLVEIMAWGEKFNPQVMEAVEVIKGNEENDQQVAEVVQKGYLFKDELLLAAKVKVFQAEEISQKAEETAKEELLKGDNM